MYAAAPCATTSGTWPRSFVVPCCVSATQWPGASLLGAAAVCRGPDAVCVNTKTEMPIPAAVQPARSFLDMLCPLSPPRDADQTVDIDAGRREVNEAMDCVAYLSNEAIAAVSTSLFTRRASLAS